MARKEPSDRKYDRKYDDREYDRKSLPAKLPKRITTVEDLLASDDVTGILDDLAKLKSSIKDLLVIFTDRDSRYHWEITKDTLVSTATWMLESTKFDLLNYEGD